MIEKQIATIWYLQKNVQGQQFWDTYKHTNCTLLMTQDFNPLERNDDA